jgi:hypothetical protein
MEITLALISSISAILVAVINSYISIRKKYTSLSEEHNTISNDRDKLIVELSAVGVLFNYNLLTVIEESVNETFMSTKAKKFLILFAVNGKTSFNHVTACYERNLNPKSAYIIRKYRRLRIDDDYKKLLKQIEFNSPVVIDTSKIKESILKQMHSSYKQDTTHVLLHFLTRIQVDQENDLLVYISISTDEPESFTDEELFVISNSINLIKDHAEEIQVDEED